MVVLLAITAFIGLDLATHATFSFLAIPFGIAGSLWSYRRRYLSKHPLTYLVSALAVVLIIICLGSAFWGQMIEKARHFLGSDRDLVLPLAASFLLVAVQVARMWSLGYQRGLANSVVISTMLMVSTVLIGNNLGFLLILMLFMGLLVPTLMLFYRSAIKLQPIGLSITPRSQQLTEKQVPWKYLTQITVVSMVLGGLLSLFAPQLRLPEISGNLPGIDQVVKNLPIQTDPTLSSPNNFSTGDDITGIGQPGIGQPGITEQPNSGSGSSPQQSSGREAELIDKQPTRENNHNKTIDRSSLPPKGKSPKIPAPQPKPPIINAEQLMNFLRIATIMLLLVAGVAWYLWLQSRQEKIVKQKEHKFNQLPMIERIYWLMLKERNHSHPLSKAFSEKKIK
jgi:hypothetical protein